MKINIFISLAEVLERNKAKIMQNVWIGLNDLRTEGTFVWLDGKKLGKFKIRKKYKHMKKYAQKYLRTYRKSCR